MQQPSSVTTATPDTAIICLVIIARLFGLPAQPEPLRHKFGKSGQPFDDVAILRAAKHIGLKAKTINAKPAQLSRLPLPMLVQYHDGRYVVVVKRNEDQDKILLQDPQQQRPLIVSQAEFLSQWNGRAVLFTRRTPVAEEARRFDVKWFIPAIVKHRHLLGEVLLASFFLQLLALVTPLFFQVVVDKVLVHHGLTTLDVLAIGLLVVSVFEVLLGGLRNYLFSHTTQRIDVVLGAKLFSHLLNLPISYFGARRVGDSVARVRELENIRNFLTGSSLTLVIDALFTLVFLAVMYYFSPMLTWIVLASIPCYALLSLIITPLLKSRLDEKFQRGAENQAFLVESIHGVETLKAMAVEPQMQQRWEEQLAGYVRAAFRASHIGNVASQSAQFINKLVVVATLWLGARLVIEGELSVGQLIAFNMLAARVSAPVLRLVQLWQDFQQARLSIERLGDILNTPSEAGTQGNRATLPRIEGRIDLDKVSFRYRPDTAEVLREISLTIKPGETIGIVGRSGSGKSTLTKLIQRLHVPERGRVLIDGVDLALVDPAWLRRQVGVVLQENVLFNRSVRDNIALSDPALPLEFIIHAAKLAGAHDFILELPEGYDTLVVERGANLSGGQRQRIALARALVTNPRILILDEATSALDYESERLIQNNLSSICQGRTVIIIAHRLSTVRSANRIIVIDKGEIIEEGNHHALLSRNGVYAHLNRLQSGEISESQNDAA